MKIAGVEYPTKPGETQFQPSFATKLTRDLSPIAVSQPDLSHKVAVRLKAGGEPCPELLGGIGQKCRSESMKPLFGEITGFLLLVTQLIGTYLKGLMYGTNEAQIAKCFACQRHNPRQGSSHFSCADFNGHKSVAFLALLTSHFSYQFSKVANVKEAR